MSTEIKSWHYAPCLEVVDGEEVWTVREVYVDAAGQRSMWSAQPDAAQGSTLEELVRCLQHMLSDVCTKETLVLSNVVTE